MRRYFAVALFAMTPFVAAAADNPAPATADAAPAAVVAVEPDLQQALDYKMPDNGCTAPVIRNANQNAGAVEKYQRAQKRYAECVASYQKGLLANLRSMADTADRAVAAKKLTNQQAETIKRHMEMVATTIKSLKGK